MASPGTQPVGLNHIWMLRGAVLHLCAPALVVGHHGDVVVLGRGLVGLILLRSGYDPAICDGEGDVRRGEADGDACDDGDSDQCPEQS